MELIAERIFNFQFFPLRGIPHGGTIFIKFPMTQFSNRAIKNSLFRNLEIKNLIEIRY
jgi:hypothetical protein